MKSNLSYFKLILLKLDWNRRFFSPCDLEIWRMTSKNNKAPFFYTTSCFLHHFKSIGEFKLELAQKRLIRLKIDHFLSRVTSKFDGWPSKMIGHLFYVVSISVYHSIAISKFKLELQSGHAQFGSKSAIFVPCDLEIWQMTFKNNRASFLCYFKLCASFCSIGEFKLELQSGNAYLGQNQRFFSRMTLKLDGWPSKTIGHLS